MWLGFAEPQRWNLGRESLLWQGFPISKHEETVAGCTEGFLSELGGNAFAGPVVTVLIAGIISLIPWSPGKPKDQTASALKLAFMAIKKKGTSSSSTTTTTESG